MNSILKGTLHSESNYVFTNVYFFLKRVSIFSRGVPSFIGSFFLSKSLIKKRKSQEENRTIILNANATFALNKIDRYGKRKNEILFSTE